MPSLALAVAEFLLHLITGKVWRAWQEHKETEAEHARNQANALDDAAAVDELRSKWTR